MTREINQLNLTKDNPNLKIEKKIFINVVRILDLLLLKNSADVNNPEEATNLIDMDKLCSSNFCELGGLHAFEKLTCDPEDETMKG